MHGLDQIKLVDPILDRMETLRRGVTGPGLAPAVAGAMNILCQEEFSSFDSPHGASEEEEEVESGPVSRWVATGVLSARKATPIYLQKGSDSVPER
jgi:hypothetical protein